MPKARHRKFREPGRIGRADFRMAFASFLAYDILPEATSLVHHTQAGPPFGDPVSVRQKSFNACGK